VTPASLSLLALVLLAACSPDAPRQPNVLLISIDTLRPDRLGSYGHERDTSPALDRIAREGVLFEDVSAASPWTLPSHASLFTGRYPSRHGVKNHTTRLRRGVPTLASVLRDAGYATKAVVNSHNLSERYGLNRGFQDFEYLPEQLEDRSIPNRGAEILAKARTWLEGHAQGPYFLFLHFYDVHTDLTPGAAYREQFVRPYEGEIDGSTKQLDDIRRGLGTLDEAGLRYLFDLYDAEIRELDDRLAEFFAWLEERGLAEDTLIVLTSDHGEEFLEHGSVLHGRTYYQEIIRIPWVMKGPGIPPGTRVAAPVHHVDMAPTLLALAGVPAPAGLDGLDLSPVWRAGAALPERTLYAEADHNNAEPDIGRMARTPRLKLIYDRLNQRVQLFDLEADPLEQDDRALHDAGPRDELLERVRSFLAGEKEREEIAPPSAEVQEQLRQLGY
jgi:arylsulfatase A-like enzyme